MSDWPLPIFDAPRCRLSKSSAQTVPTSAYRAVRWETETFDSDTMHTTSTSNLTGTVSKTSAGNTLTGSSTSFTTELAVGDAIFVPDATYGDHAVVTAIASNTSLTINGTWSATASGQTARFANEEIVIKTPGLYFIYANVRWLSGTTTGTRESILRKNGMNGTFIGGNRLNATIADSGLYVSVPVIGVAELSQYECIHVEAHQNAGADKDIENSVANQFFAICLVPS